MKKTENNSRKILDFLAQNGPQSTTQVGEYLGMTTVSAFLNLRNMYTSGLLDRIGKGKNTRYSLPDNLTEEQRDVLVQVADIMRESGFEDTSLTTILGIQNILLTHFTYVGAIGTMQSGVEGFIAWCIDPKRKYIDRAVQIRELVYWLTRYYELEVLRRKHGFFDGTASLREVEIIDVYMGTFIDTLLFHDIVEISGFGKTKIAWELYLGKQNSDRVLLERAIAPSVADIKKYIQDKKIDAVIFTPPTIPRSVQFRNVLRDMLDVHLFEIEVFKTVLPDRVLRAQKTLKGIERIINARENIVLEEFSKLQKYSHILILDDNFTTGATMNAIAEKLKRNGFTGKITAITLTGKFHDVVLSDDAEI